jgi:predicted dinucleotide-binding enzyme
VFAAGDDDAAKRKVLEMATSIGFDAVDAGPLSNARLLEPLALLNIRLGYNQKMGTDMGLRLVH